MANFSITDVELLDTVNYVISGPVSIGQEVAGIGVSNSVYFLDNIAPYAESASFGVPSPPPAKDVWIKTDCFATVNIDTPDQKVSVGAQLRCYISYDVTSAPAVLRVQVGILRFNGTADSVIDTNSGTLLSGTITTFSNANTGTVTDEFIGNQIIVSYIDQPAIDNTSGVYTYWLMLKASDDSGVSDVLDMGADVRNLLVSKIKS